jgi:hypothetical protein
MKIDQPYKCNYCDKQKEEANHWFIRLVGASPVLGFNLYRWDEVDPDTTDCEHICSQECASKALSQWMSQRANAGPSQPVEGTMGSADAK